MEARSAIITARAATMSRSIDLNARRDPTRALKT